MLGYSCLLVCACARTHARARAHTHTHTHLGTLSLLCGCRGAGGRHAFIFMRHVNTWGYLGLQVFCGLPFMYELRAVLDWSCTPTTLKLFDWLKLEDISTSLYFVTCDRKAREGRQLGDRQPRYMKFCQVGITSLDSVIYLSAVCSICVHILHQLYTLQSLGKQACPCWCCTTYCHLGQLRTWSKGMLGCMLIRGTGLHQF